MTARSARQKAHTARLAALLVRPRAQPPPAPPSPPTASWWLCADFGAALRRELPRLTAVQSKTVYRRTDEE